MNKIFRFFILAFCFIGGDPIFSAVRTGDQSGWPVVKLRPVPNSNLSLLFDSGMRPYRFPGLENYSLEVKHVRLVVLQSSGISLPEFGAELVDIDVKRGGLLSSLVLKNAPMTLSESRKEMLRWMKFGNNPVRNEADLDLFLTAVEKDYRGYNYGPNAIDHNFSISWGEKNEVRYSVWFQQARHPVTPLVLHMGISFPLTPIQAGTSYDIPIPPPPGYEDVNMTAPKDFGPDNPPDDPEIERVRKAGVMPDYSMLPKEKIRSRAMPQPPHRSAAAPETAEVVQPQASSAAWLWWIVGGAAILVFIAIEVSKRRR